ncbi:MAG: hypothetical protein AAC990_06125 [Dehalococcoides mccartyi]|uniref:hypothetical protein n=1 Tax=Dehalococcoides mccartyi TaxID=61435 RepID=UPI0030F53B23
MAIGFVLAVAGMLLAAIFTVATGIDPRSVGFPEEAYVAFQGGIIIGGGLFILGLVKIIASAIVRSRPTKED